MLRVGSWIIIEILNVYILDFAILITILIGNSLAKQNASLITVNWVFITLANELQLIYYQDSEVQIYHIKIINDDFTSNSKPWLQKLEYILIMESSPKFFGS